MFDVKVTVSSSSWHSCATPRCLLRMHFVNTDDLTLEMEEREVERWISLFEEIYRGDEDNKI